MKITGLESIILEKKVEKPVSDALHSYGAGRHVVIKVFTDEGVTGCTALNFGRVGWGADVLKTTLDKGIEPLIVGENPFFSRRIREKLWTGTEYHGVKGITQFAISAIDLCVWDIVGKALNKPVCHVLGGYKDRIPAYAMVGWYYDREEEFVKKCVDAVEEGFKAIKIKVGKYSLDDDIDRINLIRREVGTNVRLMVDANRAFDEVEALRRGKVYEELGIYWYEEPMQPYLKENHARLSSALSIPLAIGENYYTKEEFYDVIKMGAGQILQPDNRRTGGVLEWLEIGAIADAAGLQIASHGGGAGNVNILCSLPNSIYLECGSLKEPNLMFSTQLVLENGEVLLPNTPGMGMDVEEEFIKKYRIT